MSRTKTHRSSLVLGALEVHNAAAGPAGTLRGPRREKEEREKRGLGGGGRDVFGVKESPSSRLDLGLGGGGRVDIFASKDRSTSAK